MRSVGIDQTKLRQESVAINSRVAAQEPVAVVE